MDETCAMQAGPSEARLPEITFFRRRELVTIASNLIDKLTKEGVKLHEFCFLRRAAEMFRCAATGAFVVGYMVPFFGPGDTSGTPIGVVRANLSMETIQNLVSTSNRSYTPSLCSQRLSQEQTT